MPTSNRIILTDVDGVLLEWEHHFTKWMLQRTLFDERGARYHPHRLLPDRSAPCLLTAELWAKPKAVATAATSASLHHSFANHMRDDVIALRRSVGERE